MGRRKSLDAQFTAHALPVCNEQKNSENNGTSQGLCATAAFVLMTHTTKTASYYLPPHGKHVLIDASVFRKKQTGYS